MFLDHTKGVHSICEIDQKCHTVCSLGRAYSSFLFGSRNFRQQARVVIASPKDRKDERKQVIFGSLTMEAADCARPLSDPILGSNRLINADIWSKIFASTCASMLHTRTINTAGIFYCRSTKYVIKSTILTNHNRNH